MKQYWDEKGKSIERGVFMLKGDNLDQTQTFSSGIQKILEILHFEKCQNSFNKTLENLKFYDSISHIYDQGKIKKIIHSIKISFKKISKIFELKKKKIKTKLYFFLRSKHYRRHDRNNRFTEHWTENIRSRGI